jgi:ATP-dependent RNA circularization protein (DNA/RNA ligase family)
MGQGIKGEMMSEYHKIETLYERDMATFKVKPGTLKNRVYGLLKSWRWTEKVDGTNIRVIWKDGKLTFGGKTDNAQIHADLIKYLYETFSPEAFCAAFPDTDEVVLYGEGYGAGIQKGGGSYSATKKFILFDVRVGEWWLSHENVCDVAQKLGIDVVPDFGEMTLEEATEMVRNGFQSRIGTQQAEGLVGRPLECLFDKKGSRLIVKLKTKDFASKC